MIPTFVPALTLRRARHLSSRLPSSSSISNRTKIFHSPLRLMAIQISPTKANEQLKVDSPPLYLDVRTPSEYADGHAPSAINVPVTLGGGVIVPDFVDNVRQAIGSNKSLIVGCKSGKRSSMAIKELEQAGFVDLQEVEGGFDAWLATDDLPIEK